MKIDFRSMRIAFAVTVIFAGLSNYTLPTESAQPLMLHQETPKDEYDSTRAMAGTAVVIIFGENSASK